VDRVELELKLNEGRNWLLEKYVELTDEQLHRPLTKSQHDPENQWSALDHLAHWHSSSATSPRWCDAT